VKDVRARAHVARRRPPAPALRDAGARAGGAEDAAALARLRAALAAYVGTHPFHNFTRRRLYRPAGPRQKTRWHKRAHYARPRAAAGAAGAAGVGAPGASPGAPHSRPLTGPGSSAALVAPHSIAPRAAVCCPAHGGHFMRPALLDC